MSTAVCLAEVGPKVGLGHYRRSGALVKALEQSGILCHFAFRDEVCRKLVLDEGWTNLLWDGTVNGLPPADIGIIDSYAVDANFFRAARSSYRVLVTIDDFADRQLDVDLVINQNLFANDLDYGQIHCLLGPDYALVDDSFRTARERGYNQSRFVVTFGGTDDGKFAAIAVEAILQVRPEAEIDVVISPLVMQMQAVEAIKQRHGSSVTIHHGADMPTLMSGACLYVGGAGSTVYEAAVAGVAIVAVVMGENHERNGAALELVGVPVIGHLDREALSDAIVGELERIMVRPLSARVDGHGAARAAKRITEMLAANPTTGFKK